MAVPGRIEKMPHQWHVTELLRKAGTCYALDSGGRLAENHARGSVDGVIPVETMNIRPLALEKRRRLEGPMIAISARLAAGRLHYWKR